MGLAVVATGGGVCFAWAVGVVLLGGALALGLVAPFSADLLGVSALDSDI